MSASKNFQVCSSDEGQVTSTPDELVMWVVEHKT